MIRSGQLRSYAAANMPENNTSLTGGAVDLTTSVDFFDMNAIDSLQVVSSDSSDHIGVQIFGRLGSGMISSEVVTVNGLTPAPTTQTAWERFMKVVKGATSAGDIAVEQSISVLAGALIGGSADQVILGSAASTTDNIYNGLVFRLTSGTSAGVIAKIISYDGTTRTATLDKLVTVDGTSQYCMSPGVVMCKLPQEVVTVRRPFYNAVAAAPGGSDRVYYEKLFWRNDSAELLQLAYVKELANPTGKIQFAVDPVVPSVSTVVNRLTAPLIPNLIFGRLPQQAPFADIASGASVGVWLQFSIPSGQTPIKSFYLSGISGQTV